MIKNILLILGHPSKESYCAAIADTYEKSAKEENTQIRRINISDLNFEDYNPDNKEKELEADLKKAQDDIKWADHLVFVYPTWWSAMPARLKSFFEKVFEPGFAFKYHQNDSMWDKLLKGKSAHVFVTMDAPYFFYWLFFGAPGHKMIKRGILKFCGIKPVTFSNFGPIISSTKEKRKTWLNEVAQIAKK